MKYHFERGIFKGSVKITYSELESLEVIINESQFNDKEMWIETIEDIKFVYDYDGLIPYFDSNGTYYVGNIWIYQIVEDNIMYAEWGKPYYGDNVAFSSKEFTLLSRQSIII